ncbi:MAG: hypothetical protein REI09_03325 [Candidatus Dactylopiibacterium sp.]|nr:hypothetical protein [Candidatus Dactylopiibacterium sp.]
MSPRSGAILLLAALLTACSSTGDIPKNTSLVPKGSLRLFPDYAIAHADVVQIGLVLGAVYLVTDPLAPNWSIEETRLEDQRVIYQLKMKAFHTGGAGEARYVLTRRLEALVREENLGGYSLERYEEGIDSRLLLPHRTAYAQARLLPREIAMPAPLQR